MGLSIICAYCSKPLLDPEHARKHVATACPTSPATKLYLALKAVLPYAESRAEDITDTRDTVGENDNRLPQANAETAKAWAAVTAAQEVIAAVEAGQ